MFMNKKSSFKYFSSLPLASFSQGKNRNVFVFKTETTEEAIWGKKWDCCIRRLFFHMGCI